MKTLKPYQKPSLPERDVFVGLRVSRELAKAIDAYAIKLQITRSHAIRQILSTTFITNGDKS